MSEFIEKQEKIIVKDGIATTKKGILDYAVRQTLKDCDIKMSHFTIDVFVPFLYSNYKKRLSFFDVTENGKE